MKKIFLIFLLLPSFLLSQEFYLKRKNLEDSTSNSRIQAIHKRTNWFPGGATDPLPVPETCNDGILNNGEEQIDCGGPNCQPCTVFPTCDDGIQNGDETGIDCGGSECDPCSTVPEGDFFAPEPVVSEPGTVDSYTPTSAVQVQNPANANKIAIINNSFDCTNCVWAPGQVISPNGGAITGTGINLNGAFIRNNTNQAFAPTARFSGVYNTSVVNPALFGAFSGDNLDDAAAIDAAIHNVEYLRATASGSYIMNNTTYVARPGNFVFNMNGSKIEVTSDAAFNEEVDQGALIHTFELNVKFYNGEIDGNQIYGRFARINLPEAFHFENMWVHNLQNEGFATSQGMRSMAFDFMMDNTDGVKGLTGGEPFTYRSTTTVFQSGFVKNCIVEDIRSMGTGLPSNVAEAFNYVSANIHPTRYSKVYHEGNVIRRIVGIEGEGIYWQDSTWGGNGGKVEDHNFYLELQRDSIYDCEDRSMKAINGSVIINDCYIANINPAVCSSGPCTSGGGIQFFTLNDFANPSERVTKIRVTNSEFANPWHNGGYLLTFGNVRDVIVQNNTFSRVSTGNVNGFGLGTSNTTGALGAIENTLISNNTFNNIGVHFITTVVFNNTIIEDLDINWTFTVGGNNGAAIFRKDQSLLLDGTGLIIRDLDIDVDIQGANFNGLINTNADFVNTTWENIDLAYASTYSTGNGEMARFYSGADFGSSNIMRNILLTNADGANSLVVEGDKTVLFENARDLTGTNISVSGGPANNGANCNDGVQNGSETGIDCGGLCAPCAPVGDPVYTRINPTFTPPVLAVSYTPSSAADLSNPANANKIAIISNNFDASNVILASGQIIQPAGGQISGTNINLNNAYIENNYQRAFATTARFSNLYDKSRLSPDTFGGFSNDTSDDWDALIALVENSAWGVFEFNGNYIANKDRRTFFNDIIRDGLLDWNMNFATIETTSDANLNQDPIANYPTIDNPGDFDQQGFYLLPLSGLSQVNIYDGTWNGNQIASRAISITGVDSFYFDNLNIINYWAPAFAIVRAVALNIQIRDGFTNGWITNNLIENINSPGNNIPNDVTGIAKAMTFSVRTNAFSNVYINNNDIRTIIGDDAEGFYSRYDEGAGGINNQVWFNIRDNNFIGCSRRAIKFDTGNGIIEDNYLESLPFAVLGETGPKQAAMLQAFSIQGGVPVYNIFVRRNEIRVLNDAYNSLWGITDASNIIVEDNIFYADVMTAQRNISISTSSTQNGLYSGDVTDYVFRNNTITNARLGMGSLYNVLGNGAEALITGNTWNFTNVNPGKYYGLIEYTSSGPMATSDRINIVNETFNVNYGAGSSLFQGLIGSQYGTINNLTLDNVTIDYTNATGIPTFPFAKIGRTASDTTAGFGPSNIIENCTIIGASGTNAIEIFGTGNPTIINSFGAGATPITVN